jgi:hypothetical protein
MNSPALAIHFDVEDAVPLPAPVGGAEHQRLLPHRGIELDKSARAGVSTRPEPVGDRVRDRAREPVPLLVLLDTEPDDVDRSRVEREAPLALRLARRERSLPLTGRVAPEVDRGAPVVLVEEGRELQVGWTAEPSRLVAGGSRVLLDDRLVSIVADQRRRGAVERRIGASEIGGEDQRPPEQGDES